MFCGIYEKTGLHRPDFLFQGHVSVDRPWSLAQAIGRQGNRVERPKRQDRLGLQTQLCHFYLPSDNGQVLYICASSLKQGCVSHGSMMKVHNEVCIVIHVVHSVQ